MDASTSSDWKASFPVRGPILGGWIITIAFVSLVVGWGSVAPIASATIASGELVVEGSRKVVQHLEGGILTAIRIKDGDRVSAGQPLVELDVTEAQARVAVVRKRLDLSLAASARLKAERDGLAFVEFPSTLEDRRNDPWVTELLQRQLDLFDGRRNAFQGQVRLFEQEVGALRQQITGLRAQQTAAERQLALIHTEHDGLQTLYEKGYATRTRLLALERAEAQLEGERGNHISEIARTQKQITETELRVAQLHKEFYVRAVDELTEVEKTLADLPDQETAAAEVLRRTIVLAPSDGIVLGLAVHTPGEVLAPGAKLLEIVPQADDLVVKATLPLAQISDVQVGEEAEIRLTSLRSRTTPTVRGKVTYISADRLQIPDDKTPHYEVKVSLSPESLSTLGDVTLVPGMPAEVFIHSGSRTMLEYISQPITDAFHRTMREK